MPSRTIHRRCLYLGIAAALAAAMIAALGAGTAQATSRGCLPGYLCLWEPDGDGHLVPSGVTRNFNPGVPVVEIDNSATNGWCDVVERSGGIVEFGRIRKGEVQEGLEGETILSVSPAGEPEVCPE